MSKDHLLSEVQEIIWSMMKDLMQMIDKGNYAYYMLGGTLLGAIRHKGFIPWDDDIDIGMPREDYDRFLQAISHELPDYLKLHTYWDDSPHHYYFSRIVDTRHEIKRKGSIVERNEDVWIDIFPLDGMPNNALVRRIHMWRLLYARARYHIATFDRVNLKRPGRPLTERVVIWLVLHTGIGTRSDPRNYFLSLVLKHLINFLKSIQLTIQIGLSTSWGSISLRRCFPRAGTGMEACMSSKTVK